MLTLKSRTTETKLPCLRGTLTLYSAEYFAGIIIHIRICISIGTTYIRTPSWSFQLILSKYYSENLQKYCRLKFHAFSKPMKSDQFLYNQPTIFVILEAQWNSTLIEFFRHIWSSISTIDDQFLIDSKNFMNPNSHNNILDETNRTKLNFWNPILQDGDNKAAGQCVSLQILPHPTWKAYTRIATNSIALRTIEYLPTQILWLSSSLHLQFNWVIIVGTYTSISLALLKSSHLEISAEVSYRVGLHKLLQSIITFSSTRVLLFITYADNFYLRNRRIVSQIGLSIGTKTIYIVFKK